MKNRTFGVEIECGHPHGTEAVSELFRRNRFSRDWSFGYDGSGVEARTPILSGPSGFKELRRAMELLRANDGYVTNSDGMHVHHGAPEFIDDKDLCVQLVKSWVNNTNLIDLFVDPTRHNRGACPKTWEGGMLERLENPDLNMPRHADEYYRNYYRSNWKQIAGRGALNIQSLDEHGTVEIRLHEGTLDPDVAESWVRFGQRFLNTVSARKSPIPTCLDEAELLKRLRVAKRAQERLLAKAASGGAAVDRAEHRPNLDYDDDYDYDEY